MLSKMYIFWSLYKCQQIIYKSELLYNFRLLKHHPLTFVVVIVGRHMCSKVRKQEWKLKSNNKIGLLFRP